MTSSWEEISRSGLWNLAEAAEKRKDAKKHFKAAKMIPERGIWWILSGTYGGVYFLSEAKGQPPVSAALALRGARG